MLAMLKDCGVLVCGAPDLWLVLPLFSPFFLGGFTSTRFPSSALLSPFLGEGSPTKINVQKKGTLVLTSLREDLVKVNQQRVAFLCSAFVGGGNRSTIRN